MIDKSALLELRLWRWQRYTALAALPLVLAHFVVQYAVFGPDATAFAQVAARLRGGLILALDVTLLATVGAHAMLGLRSILQDYAGPRSAARITRATLGAFVAILAYGVCALIAFL